MLSDDEFAAWFTLLEAPGLGRVALRRLLAHCGSPQQVLALPQGKLRSLVGPDAAQALLRPELQTRKRLLAAQAWRHGGAERAVLVVGDAHYPPLLLNAPDPPLLLYVQGQLEVLGQRGLAVVGSRNASAQGRDTAQRLAAALSQRGLVIYSGLAVGIDAAAHEGALAGAAAGGAATVAVLGTGLDRVYPAQNQALAQRIAEQGALVSEFSPGTPAMPLNFPQRNRIIAGLSLGTLVVEAAMRSGSLITARLAAEAGREVFAVPGSIHAPQSKGCHDLLKQGAKLVETAQDILDELEQGARPGPQLLSSAPRRAPTAASKPRPKLNFAASTAGRAVPPSTHQPDPTLRSELRALLQALSTDTLDLYDLLARTGASAEGLLAQLLELELEGFVERLVGGRYQARFRA